MREAGDLVFTVHAAGAPAPDHRQRCFSCGFVLLDNSGWDAGLVAVPDADAGRGPSWYPVGALVATDKTEERRGGMTYVVPSERPLAGDERPCTG